MSNYYENFTNEQLHHALAKAVAERDEAREKLSHAQELLTEMQDALKLAVKKLLGKKDA